MVKKISLTIWYKELYKFLKFSPKNQRTYTISFDRNNIKLRMFCFFKILARIVQSEIIVAFNKT